MNLRHFFYRFAPIVIGASLIFYFVYHGFAGKRGILQYWGIQQQIDDEQYKLLMLRKKSAVLEKKIKRLHPQNIDLGFLEEQVIRILHYIPQDALLVIDPDAKEDGVKK
jgi:cell division protein FtsB